MKTTPLPHPFPRRRLPLPLSPISAPGRSNAPTLPKLDAAPPLAVSCASGSELARGGGCRKMPPPPPVERVVPTGRDSDPAASRHLPFEPSGWDSDPSLPPPHQAEAEKPLMSWADMVQEHELTATTTEVDAAADDDGEEGEEVDEGAAGAATVSERAAEGRLHMLRAGQGHLVNILASRSTPACSAAPSRSASSTTSTACRRWGSVGSLEASVNIYPIMLGVLVTRGANALTLTISRKDEKRR